MSLPFWRALYEKTARGVEIDQVREINRHLPFAAPIALEPESIWTDSERAAMEWWHDHDKFDSLRYAYAGFPTPPGRILLIGSGV